MGDDGIGAYICSGIAAKKITGVAALITHQLDSNLLEELTAADDIIIADAATATSDAVRFFKVSADEPAGVSSAHYMSASLLMQMARLVYNKELSIMICAVTGYNFSLREKLSVRAKKNADSAITIICKWIEENN